MTVNKRIAPPCDTCGHPQTEHLRISMRLPDEWCRRCPGDPTQFVGSGRHLWNTGVGVTEADRDAVAQARRLLGEI